MISPLAGIRKPSRQPALTSDVVITLPVSQRRCFSIRNAAASARHRPG